MVIEVVRRQDPEAVREILDSVPDWFGIPESNANYVRDGGRLPSYLAVDSTDDRVVGVALISEHFPPSRELHLIAVRGDRHREGIGRLLLETIEEDLRAAGVRILEVHTLGPSDDDEGYARTREFYFAQGFIPISELPLVGEEDPILVLVKPL
jgi:GNAT superfamily N-acetyltransferase